MAVYGKWVEHLVLGELSGQTVKCLLVTSGYTQDASHAVRADVTAEIVAPGYTAGGESCSNVALTLDATTLRMTIDPIEWPGLDPTDVAGAIFYRDTGSAATDRLLAADLFGPVEVEDLVTFRYTPSPDGIVVASF